MAPVRSYTNWNSRTTDEEEQIGSLMEFEKIMENRKNQKAQNKHSLILYFFYMG